MTIDLRDPGQSRENYIRRQARLLDVPEEHLLAIWRNGEDMRVGTSSEERLEVARHVLWHLGDRERGYQPGSFVEGLLMIWGRADAGNQGRLLVAFPLYGHALSIARSQGAEALLEWAEAGR